MHSLPNLNQQQARRQIEGALGSFIGGAECNSSVPVPEIDDQLNRLHSALEKLERLQSTLASRLGPVSAMPAPCNPCAEQQVADFEPRSRVGTAIKEARNTVDRLNGYIEECLRLLAI